MEKSNYQMYLSFTWAASQSGPRDFEFEEERDQEIDCGVQAHQHYSGHQN
jgi:hypothetical protein